MPAVSVSGGGGNAPRKGGAVSVSSKRGVDLSRVQSRAPNLQALADVHKGGGPVASALGNVVSWAQKPSQAVGNLIAGHPKDAFKNVVQFVEPGSQAFIDARETSPGEALAGRGWLPGGKLGAALKFGADVGLDPTTYLTAGVGAGVKAGAKAGIAAAAARGSAEVAKATSTAGVMRALADSALTVGAAKKAAPKTLQFSVRAPFSRGSGRVFAETRVPGAKLAAKAGPRVPEGLRTVGRALSTTGMTDKAVHNAGQAVRRYTEVQKGEVSALAKGFERDVQEAAKTHGVKPQDALSQITRHLDQPGKHPVPEWLAPLADRAKGMLGDWRQVEHDAGIVKKGDVESYIPHLPATPADRRIYQQKTGSAWNADQFFNKQRTLKNLDQWFALGVKPEMNAARLLEVRGHAHLDELGRATLDDSLVKAFGKKGPTTSEARALLGDQVPKPRTWEDVTGGYRQHAMKYHGTVKLPPHVAEAHSRIQGLIEDSMRSPDAAGQVMRFAERVTSRWKGLALATPGYHFRNMQGDFLQAWWAGGRNPQSYVQAAHMLGRKGAGRGLVKLKTGEVTHAEMLEEAKRWGVIKTGQIGQEIDRNMAGYRTGVSKVKPSAPGTGRAARASQAVGQGREDMVRLGTYIDLRKSGLSPTEAADRVRHFLLDYGETSDFVRRSRRFFLPFVTYPAKMLPVVARRTIERPGSLSTYGHVTSALQDAAGNPDLTDSGIQGGFAVPLGPAGKFLGAPGGQPMIYDPNKTFSPAVLNQFIPEAGTTGAFGKVAKLAPGRLLNPAMTEAIFQASGYDPGQGFTYQNLDRSKAKANAATRTVADILGVKLGTKVDKYTGKSVPAIPRRLDHLLGMLPAYRQSGAITGDSEAANLARLRYLVGLNLYPYDRARAEFYAKKYGGR